MFLSKAKRKHETITHSTLHIKHYFCLSVSQNASSYCSKKCKLICHFIDEFVSFTQMRLLPSASCTTYSVLCNLFKELFLFVATCLLQDFRLASGFRNFNHIGCCFVPESECKGISNIWMLQAFFELIFRKPNLFLLILQKSKVLKSTHYI